jgi:hypothetical protein
MWPKTAVRVICAWCQKEGRSGLLRVREPVDDVTETHGICDRHQQQVFEAFPSASFPSTRWLFIVPNGDASGYEHLSELLKDVPGAMVIEDRRRGDRRRSGSPPVQDRRRFDRRVRRPETNGLGYRLIRFTVQQNGALKPIPGQVGASRQAAVEETEGEPHDAASSSSDAKLDEI